MQAIAIEGVAAEVFVALLDHLYTDSTEVAAEMALPLFAAADRFGVERLKLVRVRVGVRVRVRVKVRVRVS